MKGTPEVQIIIEEELHSSSLKSLHRDDIMLQSKKVPRNDLTAYGASLAYRAVQELATDLAAYYDSLKKSRQKRDVSTEWVKAVYGSDMYTVAHLLVTTALRGIHTYPSEISLRCSLAAALIHEYDAKLFQESFPGYYTSMMQLAKRVHSAKERGKLLASGFNKADMDVHALDAYNTPDRYRLGEWCWIWLKKSLPWLLTQELMYIPSRRRSSPVACLTASIDEWKGSFLEQVAERSIAWTPMVVPPIEYTAAGIGGYIKYGAWPVKCRSFGKAPAEKIGWGKLWLSSLEAVQRTPWSVDLATLSTMQALIRCNHESLPTVDIPKPERPPGQLDKESNVWLEYRTKCRQHQEMLKKAAGNKIGLMSAAKVAMDTAKYDAIYMPQQCDFRGRGYSRSSALSPQGADYSKGLIRFANKKPLGDRGAYWLAVHLANLCGVDKVSFAERVAWTHEHSDEICRWATSPQRYMGWLDADKPWQALLAAQDWQGLCDHGESYESSVPVAMDGSNNGLQHLSAIVRDPIGAQHVNMTASDIPQDVYAFVASKLCEHLETVRASGGMWTTRKGKPQEAHYNTAQMARIMLDNIKVDRSLIKRAVMTYCYNATPQSMGDNMRGDKHGISDRIRAGADSEGLSEFVLALWLARPMYGVIGDNLKGASLAMDWFSKSARAIAKAGHTAIEFDTPAGFHFYQTTEKMKLKRVHMLLNGKHYYYRVPGSSHIATARAATAFAPNIVHSLDATHMWLTVAQLHKQGITDFAMVHDSYGTHACDIDAMHGAIRESFVGLYDNYCPIKALTEAYPEVELPEEPTKGSYNIHEVLNAPYFFA